MFVCDILVWILRYCKDLFPFVSKGSGKVAIFVLIQNVCYLLKDFGSGYLKIVISIATCFFHFTLSIASGNINRKFYVTARSN